MDSLSSPVQSSPVHENEIFADMELIRMRKAWSATPGFLGSDGLHVRENLIPV